MSSFLFSASLTLVLLSILSLSIAEHLVIDIEGDPILTGKGYYIVPLTTPFAFTYTQKNDACPLYITQGKNKNSPNTGTPVTIFVTNTSTVNIDLDERVGFAFKGPTPCDDSPAWTQTLDPLTRKLYITTGGASTAPYTLPFSITSTVDGIEPFYEFKFWSSDSEEDSRYVGVHKDGLLGITDYPTTMLFMKAFNVVESSTS